LHGFPRPAKNTPKLVHKRGGVTWPSQPISSYSTLPSRSWHRADSTRILRCEHHCSDEARQPPTRIFGYEHASPNKNASERHIHRVYGHGAKVYTRRRAPEQSLYYINIHPKFREMNSLSAFLFRNVYRITSRRRNN